MTRAQVRVLLITLAVVLVPAMGLATWDHWLVVHRNDDTISWSFAELLYHHIAIAAAVILEVGLVVGYLLCHFTAFTLPDPSYFAELDAVNAENERLKAENGRAWAEVARLRIQLANHVAMVENFRGRLAEAKEKGT